MEKHSSCKSDSIMKQTRMETSRKQAILCELSKAPRYLQRGQILRVHCVL